jgi:hypothetical protein
MKNILTAVLCLVAGSVISASPRARAAVSDDFTDLNDTANPAWTHLTGYVGSTGQTWSASTGQYRLMAPNNGLQGFGFVGSYVGTSFDDVTVTADIVSFIDDPVNQGGTFGVAARLNGMNGFGELTGYGYAYEPYAAGGAGEMVLYRINQGVDLTDLGAQPVTLDPARDYRIVLDIRGGELHGQVFEIGGGMVAERFRTDNTYASGFPGLFGYSQTPGPPPTDITWDNFSAVPEPAAGLFVSVGAAAMLLRRRSLRMR